MSCCWARGAPAELQALGSEDGRGRATALPAQEGGPAQRHEVHLAAAARPHRSKEHLWAREVWSAADPVGLQAAGHRPPPAHVRGEPQGLLLQEAGRTPMLHLPGVAICSQCVLQLGRGSGKQLLVHRHTVRTLKEKKGVPETGLFLPPPLRTCLKRHLCLESAMRLPISELPANSTGCGSHGEHKAGWDSWVVRCLKAPERAPCVAGVPQ